MAAVYIAAPLAAFEEAQRRAEELRSSGHTVVSTWHSLVMLGQTDPPDAVARGEILHANLMDMSSAEVLLALLYTPNTPRATLVELGYLLARQRRVVWWLGPNGEGSNIFTSHPRSTVVQDLAGALKALAELSFPAPASDPRMGVRA